MFLLGKNNPAIVSRRTREQACKLAAQPVRFQTRVGEVFGHALECRSNLRLQRGILGGQTAESALESRREYEFVHGLLGRAQTGNDTADGSGL